MIHFEINSFSTDIVLSNFIYEFWNSNTFISDQFSPVRDFQSIFFKMKYLCSSKLQHVIFSALLSNSWFYRILL